MPSKVLHRSSLLTLLFACALGFGCSKEAKLDRHLKAADQFFAQGDYDRARIEYLGAQQFSPQNPRVVLRLGKIYFEQGAVLQAAPFLIKAKELEPRNAEVRADLASFYLMVGDARNAQAEAFAALDLAPGNAEAVLVLTDLAANSKEGDAILRRLGDYAAKARSSAVYTLVDAAAAFRRKDLAGAEQAARRGVAQDPKFAAGHFVLGNILAAQTNLAGAAEAFRTAAECSPPRSVRWVRYAEFKARQEGVEAGRKVLKEVSTRAPDYLPALQAQMDLAMQERRPDEARAFADNILGRYPVHLEANLVQARLLLIKNEPQRAVELLERLVKIYGRSTQLRVQLGLACLAARDVVRATSNLEAALALDPTLPEAALPLAQLRIGRGDQDGAITLLQRLVKARPLLDRSYLLLGEAYMARGRTADGLAVYGEFSRVFPKDPRGPFLVGLVHRQSSLVGDARAAFLRSLDLDPHFLPAHGQLVELDLVAKDLDGALRRATEVVKASPEQAGGFLLLGRVQLARRESSAAEVSLKRAIDLDPTTTGAYLALAGIYREANRQTEALRQLEALLEKNPRDVAALMMKATILSGQQKPEKAKAAYETLLQVNPNFSPALNNLAYLHTEQIPDLAKAWSYARRARELLPNSPVTADTLGWVHFKRGEYPEALRLLLEAAERIPDQPEVQFHVGMAYYMMAQAEPARLALGRAVGATVDFQGKDEARRRLAALAGGGGSGERDIKRQLESFVREQPGDVLSLIRLGEVYEAENSPAKARQAYEDALKANPNLARPLIRLARMAAAQPGQREAALQLVRRARDLLTSDPSLLREAGRIAAECGDAVQALGLLQEAGRRLGESPELTLDLAEVSYLAGRIEEAGRLAVKAKEGASGALAEQARQLEWLVQAVQNPAAAAAQGEATIRALAKARPNSVPAIMALATVQGQQGAYAEARDAYEGLLARLPAFAPARRALAVLYAGPLKDDRKGLEHATKAREALPGDAVVARTLGVLTYRKGDYRYASQLLGEAARTLKDDGELLFYLGMSQRQLKQTKEAAESLRRAVALQPTGSYVAEANQALAGLK